MNILVTGGCGFIGRHVCTQLLEQGHEVTSIDSLEMYDLNDFERNSEYKAVSSIKSANRDFLIRLNGIHKFFNIQSELHYEIPTLDFDYYDFIIHLAAKAGVIPSFSSPTEYFNTNLIDTIMLAKECVYGKRLKGFIFASSSSVNSSILSPYAISKKAASEFLDCYFRTHAPKLLLDILEYHTVYGPHMRPDLFIPKALDCINRGEKIQLRGMGKLIRNYTFVEDVAKVTTNCIKTYEKRVGTNIFKVAHPIALSNSHVFAQILKCLGKADDFESACTFAIKHTEGSSVMEEPLATHYLPYDRVECEVKLGYSPNTPLSTGLPITVDQLMRSRIKV